MNSLTMHYIELEAYYDVEGNHIRPQQCLHCSSVEDLEQFNDKGTVVNYPIANHVIRYHLQ